MDHERRLVGEALDLGGLLVAYVFVGLPVGSIATRFVQSVNRPLPLTAMEAGFAFGALVIATAEVTGNRPGPVGSIGFFAANAAIRVPLVIVIALSTESHSIVAVGYLVAALIAYVLAIRWGAAETARRFRDALGRLTWVPDHEDPAERR
ncbi:hypothetical protein ACFQMA_23715 [Halosimplex aquaticum]|uniref:Uncharacterized protein n=1 Tax=Halosimplex aquaticum TaxID=3026162 RepID=A0ABD5XWE4_9EURY|nr:hypothetical protein [Halosimplex aquaticum]